MVHVFEALKQKVGEGDLMDEDDLPSFVKRPPCVYPSSMTVTDHDGTEKKIVLLQVSEDSKYHVESLLRYMEAELLSGDETRWPIKDIKVQRVFGYPPNEILESQPSQPSQPVFLTKKQQENFLVEFFPRLPLIAKRRIVELCGTLHPQRVVLSGRPQHMFSSPGPDEEHTVKELEVINLRIQALPHKLQQRIFSYLPAPYPEHVNQIINHQSISHHLTGCSVHKVNVPGNIVCNGGVRYQASGYMFASKETLAGVIEDLGCYNMLAIERDEIGDSQDTAILPASMSRSDDHVQRESVGQIINFQRDMLILRGGCSELWTAKRLQAALTRQNAIHKVKSIALYASHADFGNLLSSLKNLPNLELVFVVVGDSQDNALCVCNPVRYWRNTHMGPEHRISQLQEVMYEDIGCSMTYPLFWDIPFLRKGNMMGSGLASCKTLSDLFKGLPDHEKRLRYQDAGMMKGLMHALCREDNGKWVCPVIRVVREVSYRTLDVRPTY
ncbi:hypothetical protein HYFRA_00004023 [Hymenoscyphus fraxineus]|uniref:Uncharacterized protein n=1 Tax=Hymenoscyphus fraxineus TaxID=746836 RepID=A0A9N9KL47_9HELO|nr:hypothetical protein HYFRA_00004023 [Hymenoscyphus fraxineus]